MNLPHPARRVCSFSPSALALAAAVAIAGMVGCSRHDSTSATPPHSGTGSDFGDSNGRDVSGPNSYADPGPPNPAGAPTTGVPSGMGFYTGNAAQAGGMGTGLMGFHDVGAAGTSGAITDAKIPPVRTEEERYGVTPETR